MAPDIHDPAVRRRLYLTLAQKRVRPGSGSSLQLLRSRTWRSPVYPLMSLVTTPFVVVGGVATRLYAPERTTLDLDVLIAAEDAEHFYPELQEGGAQNQGSFAILGTHWLLPDGTPLDVLESAGPWIRQALAEAVTAPDGLPIISLPYLTLLKLRSSRAIDGGDLSRMLGGAEEGALEQVRAVIRTHQPDAVEDLESYIQLGRLEYETRQGG